MSADSKTFDLPNTLNLRAAHSPRETEVPLPGQMGVWVSTEVSAILGKQTMSLELTDKADGKANEPNPKPDPAMGQEGNTHQGMTTTKQQGKASEQQGKGHPQDNC